MTCAKYISCKSDFAEHLDWGKTLGKTQNMMNNKHFRNVVIVLQDIDLFTLWFLTFVMMKTSDKRRCTLCRWSRKLDFILSLDWFWQMTAITPTQFWNSDNEFHKMQIWDENGVESILNSVIYGKKIKQDLPNRLVTYSSSGRSYRLLRRISPTCCT